MFWSYCEEVVKIGTSITVNLARGLGSETKGVLMGSKKPTTEQHLIVFGELGDFH